MQKLRPNTKSSKIDLNLNFYLKINKKINKNAKTKNLEISRISFLLAYVRVSCVSGCQIAGYFGTRERILIQNF